MDEKQGIRAFRFERQQGARGGITRRSLLQAASTSGLLLTTEAWADAQVMLQRVANGVQARRGSDVFLFKDLFLGPNRRFSIRDDDTVVGSPLAIGGWSRPSIEFTFTWNGSRAGIRAVLPDSPLVLWPRFEEIFFDDWLAGRAQLRTVFKQKDADALLKAALPSGAEAKKDIELAIDRDLSWHAIPYAEGDVLLENRKVSRAGIRFSLIQSSESKFASFAPAAAGRFFVEAEAQSDDDRAVQLGSAPEEGTTSQLARTATLSATPTGKYSILVERRSPTEELSKLEGPVRIEVRSGTGADLESHFEAASFRRVRLRSGSNSRTSMIAWLRSGAQSISIGRVPVVALVPDGDDQTTGMPKRTPDISSSSENGQLKTFEGHITAQQICLAVRDADYSRLTCRATPIKLGIGTVPPSAQVDKDVGKATLGPLPNIEFPLDSAKLHVRRAKDLLDLKFTFQDLSLLVRSDNAYLISRAAPANDKAALLAVHFPPQHVAERAYFRQGNGADDACVPPSIALMFPDPSDIWFADFKKDFDARLKASDKLKTVSLEYEGPASLRKFPELSQDIRKVAAQSLDAMRAIAAGGDDNFDEITEARLSGPSRVAFRVPYNWPNDQSKRFEISYQVDSLTDWRNLELSVIRRAESVLPASALSSDELKLETDTARRLAFMGLQTKERAPNAADRLDDIVKALTPPGNFQTSIEMPFRLFLSPDRQARFLTPRPSQPKSDAIPLWTAELDWHHPIERRGIGEVRAVWSTDFRPSVFERSGVRAPPRGAIAPWQLGPRDDGVEKSKFRTALDAYDRHEIVILSSVYGLPVLATADAEGKLTGDKVIPPTEFALRDLATPGQDEARGQAIYDPQPLGVRELGLSMLGGNLDLDANFEPPYAAKGLFPALSVERWRQRTVLGRDVLVEVVYKGFLFPIGHRCVLVKLTERTFAANPGGYPTAYLTQRMFLRISKPTKQYPAIGQPFEGRGWPASAITLVTRRTPDIVDPTEGFNKDPKGAEPPDFALTPSGRLLLANGSGVAEKLTELAGLVFWPRTGNCRGSEVRFEFRIDGSAETVHAPLIFVDNVTVDDSKTDALANVVKYYNSLEANPTVNAAVESSQARWSHGGAIRRYAPEQKANEASLLSMQWVVGAEGRRPSRAAQNPVLASLDPDVISAENVDHGNTPVLAAAEQPPFYPRLRSAVVRPQSFERLAGRQTRPLIARYLPQYLMAGFNWDEKKETFLSLSYEGGADVDLRFSGGDAPPTGDRGGGVGQPHLSVNALSRKFGPTRLDGTKTATKAAILNGPKPIRLASLAGPMMAQTSTSQPAGSGDSLKELLKGAKILGLPMVDLVTGLGVDLHPILRETTDFGLAGAGDAFKGALSALKNALIKIVKEFDQTITNKSKEVNLKALLTLYPDFLAAEDELRTALGKTDDIEAIAAATEPARRLVAALGRAAADPLAPVREGARDAFRRLLTQLVFPTESDAQALLNTINTLRSGFGGAIRVLLSSPDTAVWRRVVLSLPSVRPEIASQLSGLDAAIEQHWAKAVDDTFAAAAEGAALASTLTQLLTRFRSDVAQYLQDQRSKLKDGSDAANEVERLARSLTSKALDELIRSLGNALDALQSTIGALDLADIRDPAVLLERLSRFASTLVALVATELPALVNRKIADICTASADALALMTASVIPTDKEREVLSNVRTGLGDASNELVQAIAKFEAAARLRPAAGEQNPWPDKAKSILDKWIQRQRTNAGVLASRLGAAVDVLLRETGSLDPSDLASRACRDPKSAPFALMQELDRVRHEALRALVEANDALHGALAGEKPEFGASDLAQLRQAVAVELAAAQLEPKARQDLLKTIDDALVALAPTLNDAAQAILAASMPIMDAATMLGAVSKVAGSAAEQAANQIRSRALDQVRGMLSDLQSAVAASPETAKDLKAAIDFFDPSALSKERELLAQEIEQARSAAADQLRAQTRALGAKINSAAERHAQALDREIQRTRAMLLAGSEQIASSAIKSIAPIVQSALSAIDAIDASISVARADAIRKLTKASAANGPLADNLGGLAALLKILPGYGTQNSNLIACPFYVVATPGASCPAGVDADHMSDALADERKAIAALSNRMKAGPFDRTAITALSDLVTRWQSDGPASVRLVRQLQAVAQEILRGDLGRFIDLAGTKAAIEKELRSLLPTKSNLDHIIGFDISPGGFLQEIFAPKPPESGHKHLEIITKSTIDLAPIDSDVSKSLRVETTGTLAPFDVKLLGSSLKVATLSFSGATFSSVNGSSPTFKISFLKFEPGEAIAFVQPLQRFLSPGETGPRIGVRKNGPGVEAGYGLNLGIISIGTVSFANVILNAVAELPFDDSDARFRVGLGRRDAPFLISAFPYTGGGYFSIIATGAKIDGFEASFEFGGGGAFSFGPLLGQGRLTTGIFIRQSGAGAYMEGFFYCGGSARIAFFGVGASLTVRMSLVGGDMAGEAVFEFTFSLGIKDFKYQVPVWRRAGNQNWQSGLLEVIPTTDHASLDISPVTGRLPRTMLAMLQPVRLAAVGGSITDVAAACRPVPSARFKAPQLSDPKEQFACVMSTAMCQSQDWKTYESYFDASLLEKVSVR